MCSPKKVSFALYIRTKRLASKRWCANAARDAPSRAMSTFWDDDSDSDSSSDDDGPTLRQRRETWRRLTDNIRAEGGAWQSGCGVPAGPRGRKKRAQEVPGTRDRRFSLQFDWRDERARRFDHTKSPWWGLVRHPDVYDERSAAGRRFRRKFRMPKVCVDALVLEASKQAKWVDKPSGPGHGRGPARAPLLLKVLAALSYLGKGCDMEDLEDLAQISVSTLRVFIPAFLKWLAHDEFAKHVHLPEGEALDRAMAVYARLGAPGACASADGVHVPWNNCHATQNHLYKGKEGHPTIAWNVSVLHSREVVHIAPWKGGATNDKSMAQHDEFFAQLRAGTFHPEKTYTLYERDGTQTVHKGLYAIVDNGYHHWMCLIPPFKGMCPNDETLLWSKRLESIRKDAECTFGTIKRRFRILRIPSELSRPEGIDNVFRACCVLHNILLRHDGLNTLGTSARHWHPQGGEALDRRRQLDAVRIHRDRTTVRAPQGVPPERDHGFNARREALIAHYNYARSRGEVGWVKCAAECHVLDDAEEEFAGDNARPEDGDGDEEIDTEDDDA